jgi:DNA-binding NarL/FixJ family response regulator
MPPAHIALYTDDRLFREGLARILASESITVVDGLEAALDRLPSGPRALRPSVVLVDSRTEGALSLCATLRRSGGVAVIFVAAPDEGAWAVEALFAGARGVLGKSARPEHLLQALEVVHDGGIWAPRRVLAQCIERLTRVSPGPRSEDVALERRLSSREREVFRHAAAGLSNKEVADRLAISRATVKAHLTQIFQKLGVTGRAQLAAVYHGLVRHAASHPSAAASPREVVRPSA